MKSITLKEARNITMTVQEEKDILESSGTHRLVYELLELTKERDCVDVYYDTMIALEILKGRMERALGH